MNIPGTVHRGKVELDGGYSLPEGARVFVFVAETSPGKSNNPVQFPLVRSKHPASLNLSNQRIAELLDDEDMSSGH